jgi:diguanylate cyclase (GGDEF)-like protein/PAS domain S-box-containing protein
MLRRYGKELALKSQLLDSTRDGIVAHTLDGHLVYCNEAAYEQLGYTREHFDEIGPWGWAAPDARELAPERTKALRERGALMFPSTAIDSDGNLVHTEVHARLVETAYGELAVSVIRDVSDRYEAEMTMRHLAFHDRLTDLPNRAKLEDDLRHALSDADRYRDIFGVVYVDLDDFKPVNDAYGHAVGDRVLLEVARRMRASIREGDTVARLGGDEFVVLALRLRAAADLAAIGRKLQESLCESMRVEDRDIRVTASVGLALHEPGESAEDLLARADHAMYRAKQVDLPGWRAFLEEAVGEV